MKELGALAVGIGLLAMGLGLLWPWIERLGLDRIGLGQLPGDIVLDYGDHHIRLPLATATVLAAIMGGGLMVWKYVLN